MVSIRTECSLKMEVKNMHQSDKPIEVEAIKAIVFDFDNVIVRGSEECKTNAWSSVFAPDSIEYKRLCEGLEKFAHGKGDRYDILGYVFAIEQGQDPRLDSRVIASAHLYNEVVVQCICNIGIASSDLDTLQLLAGHYPLYIVSATPEPALVATLLRLAELYKVDLLHMFTLVLGTPNNKHENFKKIHESSLTPTSAMLMVGDGLNDYDAARQAGSWFVGVRTPANESAWKDASFNKVTAIDMLPTLLELSQERE